MSKIETDVEFLCNYIHICRKYKRIMSREYYGHEGDYNIVVEEFNDSNERDLVALLREIDR